MIRSCSRAPRQRLRSLSPIPRKSEYHKQRHSHEHYSCDNRTDPERSTTERNKRKKHGQSISRTSCGNEHYRIYEHRSPSPNIRRSSLDQVHSPGRRDRSRRSQDKPRHSEGVHYQEYCSSDRHQQAHGRYISDDHRVRSGREGNPHQRSIADSFSFEGKWHEDKLRCQKIQGGKYPQSRRKGSEDLEKRSFSQKRYPEDHEYRTCGHNLKRPTGVEKYEDRERSRSPQQKHRHSLLPYQEKKDQWTLRCQYHRHSQRKLTERSPTKVSSDYSQKCPKASEGHQDSSDGRTQKYSKEEDRKSISQNDSVDRESSFLNAGSKPETKGEQVKLPETSSASSVSSDYSHEHHKASDDHQDSSDGRTQRYSEEEDRKSISQNDSVDRESSYLNAGSGPETEGKQVKEPFKPSKKDCTTSAHSNKRYVRSRHYSGKQKKKRKKRDHRSQSSFSSDSLDESQLSDEESSSASHRKKSVVIKVDRKKTLNTSRVTSSKTERQMAYDLVAAGRKSKNLHPVFEHVGSTWNTKKKPTKELFQEVVTVLHQGKETCFPSSHVTTLHERFSKIQASDRKGIQSNSAPETHRRLDIPLDERPSKKNMVCRSEQTLVKMLDPEDLRHGIERKRKERLQNEDEHIFHHIASAAERHGQYPSVPTYIDEFQHPKHFMTSNSGKFILESHMANFGDGRFQPHYNLGLPQYQCLWFTGSRGFTTANYRERLLRNQMECTDIATAE